MQNKSIANVRYPESRKRFFLNFVLSLWFEKRVKEILAEGNAARIKRYKSMDPFEMVIEAPLVFDTVKKQFRSCIVDRPAGTLLVDQNVPLVDFKTFLSRSDLSDKINQSGDYSQDVADIVKEGISLPDIISLIHQPEKLSKDPIFYLAKLKDSDEFVVLFDHTENDPKFEDMVSWIFRDYTFENITMEVAEEGDATYPNVEGSLLADFYSGKVTVKDSLLIEGTLTFNFLDLKQLVDIIDTIDMNIVTAINAGKISTISDLETTSPTIGNGVVVTTSKVIDKSKLIIKKMVDDLGAEITANGTLVIGEVSEKDFPVSVSMKDYPSKFGFKHPDGYRRKVGIEIGIVDTENSSQSAEILIDYDLKDKEITPSPIKATLDKELGNKKVALEIVLVNAQREDISELIPQQFKEGQDLFVTSNPVAADETAEGSLSANGVTTTVGTSDSGRPIIKFDVSIDMYGNFSSTFTDTAVADISGSIAEEVDDYKLDQTGVELHADGLVLIHNLTKDGKPYGIRDVHFNGTVPIVVINEKEYTPAVTWDSKEGKLQLLYSFDEQIKTVAYDLESKFYLGLNSWPVVFTSKIDISPKISKLALPNGELLSYNAGNTYSIAQTGIADTSIRDLKPEDIELVSIIDPAGKNITSKAVVSPTDNGNDGNSFFIPISLTDYPFPMSFNDPAGPDGLMDITVGVKGYEGSSKTEKYGYKLSRPNGSIRPWVTYVRLGHSGKDNAVVEVAFLGADNKRINTGVEQSLPSSMNIFGEGTNQLTYLGDKVTYRTNEDSTFVAQIPAKIDKYGNFKLIFADQAFKTDESSVADPNNTYELKKLDSNINPESKQLTIRYELYMNGERYTIITGKTVKSSLKLNSNGEALFIGGTGWTYNKVDAAILTISAAIKDGSVDQNYELTGKFYIGANLVPIDMSSTGITKPGTGEYNPGTGGDVVEKKPTLTDKDGSPIEDGAVITDNQPTFSGEGMKPDYFVTITDNGEEIGQVLVDADGKWTFKPEPPLKDGEHKFNVQGTQADDKATSGDLTITVDTSGNATDDGENVDVTEGGKYAGPGEPGMGMTVEPVSDISGVQKTYANTLTNVKIIFPYVTKGSID